MLNKTIRLCRQRATVAHHGLRQSQRLSCMYSAQVPRFFSTEGEAKPEAAGSAPVPEPTQAELDQGRQEWGLKYDDECLKFEKEWQIMAKAVEDQQAVYLESELGDLQKEKVKMLANKVLDLNLLELRYFHVMLVEQAQKSTGLNPMKLNLDWPSIKRDAAGTWPPANPNWFK